MRYLLLIYSQESHYDTVTEAEMGELMTAYGALGEELEAAGVVRGSERLKPSQTATSVRLRDGKTMTTDGPFAETKEQLGGYYEIEVENLDEALKWAKKIPTAAYGTIEVRPIWEMGDM